MCIICVKSQGVKAPNKELIDIMFENNPDGCGIAVMRPRTTLVDIEKGFMTADDMRLAIKDFVRDDDYAVLHFRIGTSGGFTPAKCHPFPVCQDPAELNALSTTNRYAFIHNGILGQGTPEFSDTQLYVKNTLCHLMPSFDNKKTQDVIAQTTVGSRTVTLDAERQFALLTGDWITDKKTGLLFSNNTYKKNKWRDYYKNFKKWDYSLWDDKEYDKKDYNNFKYSPSDLKNDYTYDYDAEAICPQCGGVMSNISNFHNILECEDCGCVMDSDEKKILKDGYHFDDDWTKDLPY